MGVKIGFMLRNTGRLCSRTGCWRRQSDIWGRK